MPRARVPGWLSGLPQGARELPRGACSDPAGPRLAAGSALPEAIDGIASKVPASTEAVIGSQAEMNDPQRALRSLPPERVSVLLGRPGEY